MGTTPFITVRARRPLAEIEFCAWVAQAVPGDRLEYHRGFLVLDIFPMFARLPDQQRAELARLGSRAFWAAEQGLVHLVQERTGRTSSPTSPSPAPSRRPQPCRCPRFCSRSRRPRDDRLPIPFCRSWRSLYAIPREHSHHRRPAGPRPAGHRPVARRTAGHPAARRRRAHQARQGCEGPPRWRADGPLRHPRRRGAAGRWQGHRHDPAH